MSPQAYFLLGTPRDRSCRLRQNASCIRNSALLSKARLPLSTTHSVMSSPVIAHQMPAITASPSERMRSQAIEPAAPSSASIKNNGQMNEDEGSVRRDMYGTYSTPSRAPMRTETFTSGRRSYQTHTPATPYTNKSAMSIRSRPLPAP